MISILCSNYNSSNTIDNYLNYLNNQIHKNFEVIFVDANSTDDSLDKIKKFEFRDGIQKKVIECDTRISIYEAWNKAIENSSYEYVMNYNTDDKLFSSALHLLSIYAQMLPEEDVIYSDCLISEDKNHNTYKGIHSWGDANSMKTLIYVGCCCGPFPLVKKKAIVDAGMFDPKFTISGDYEMWCRLNSKGSKFIKIQEPVGVFYDNPEGRSSQKDEKRLHEQIMEDTDIRLLYKDYVL
tara:strand:- start:6200 stop:6913 length:714 start_codon:yes stop_codon:yes gene_type:complete